MVVAGNTNKSLIFRALWIEKGENIMAKVVKRRGKWVLDFTDNEGIRRWITTKGSKEQAEKRLREILNQLDNGEWISQKKIPTFKEVAEQWLEYKKPSIRLSTWRKYEGYHRNHFSCFHNYPINRVPIAMIEKYINEKMQSGMSIVTLRKTLVMLNQVMAYAVRHKFISNNPCRDIEKLRKNGKTEKTEISILKPDEIKSLLQNTGNPKYEMLFRLAIFSGAREGELLGLKWSDIHWEDSQIEIERTFNEGAFQEPKTETSYRKIDIGQNTMSELKKWKVACPPNDLDLVFPNEAGKPMNHNNMVNRHFKPAMVAANIEKIRFHDMRHSYASLMLHQGESIKYIQKQMGHSSPTVTLNIYSHLIQDQNLEAVNKLEKAIFESDGHKMVTK